MRWTSSLAIAFALLLAGPSHAQWTVQESRTQSRLRGVSAVSADVAWASGAKGTVIRTADGGSTWTARPVPGASEMDFRDIEAIDARTAYVLSIGEGDKSRIYKTADGGESWALQFTNRDPKGFLDALAFWDADHGIALGDPVGGRYTILTTDDGGVTWTQSPIEGMPPALAGEGAFAASGTCLIARGDRSAWFGTGGGAKARVFRSEDRGLSWAAQDTPMRAGSPTSGIFSLAFRSDSHGVVVGGSYDQADRGGAVAARTEDGGRTWTLCGEAEPGGFRSAAAYVGRADRPSLVAVGPSGSDRSEDDGKTWAPLGPMGFHAVGFARDGSGWAVGEGGVVARFAGPKAPR